MGRGAAGNHPSTAQGALYEESMNSPAPIDVRNTARSTQCLATGRGKPRRRPRSNGDAGSTHGPDSESSIAQRINRSRFIFRRVHGQRISHRNPNEKSCNYFNRPREGTFASILEDFALIPRIGEALAAPHSYMLNHEQQQQPAPLCAYTPTLCLSASSVGIYPRRNCRFARNPSRTKAAHSAIPVGFSANADAAETPCLAQQQRHPTLVLAFLHYL